MQHPPQSLFELTPAEQMNFNGANRFAKAPPEYRLRQARQQVIKSIYEQFPGLNLGEVYQRPDYDQSVTIPEFNRWVDSMWEKKLAQIQALRAATELRNGYIDAIAQISQNEDDANGEVLR